jgi:hypothetical protein
LGADAERRGGAAATHVIAEQAAGRFALLVDDPWNTLLVEATEELAPPRRPQGGVHEPGDRLLAAARADE